VDSFIARQFFAAPLKRKSNYGGSGTSEILLTTDYTDLHGFFLGDHTKLKLHHPESPSVGIRAIRGEKKHPQSSA